MSMRNMDDLNLKDAFSPMPGTCRDALMNAVRSVEEDNPMKRATYRVALIAAVIIVALMAVAFAASQLGLVDFFNRYHDDRLPDSAKAALSATEQKSYEVGPLTITLRETLADGRLAYLTTQARTTDGSPAVMDSSCGDVGMQIWDTEAARLKVPPKTTIFEAAKQAGVPLYVVTSYLTIEDKYHNGEEMQDIIWAEDGSALLVDMLQTDPALVPETLTGVLTLQVQEIDLTKDMYAEDRCAQGKDWSIEAEISISVGGVTAERTYLPEGNAEIMGYTVESIKAQQTCAGVYLTSTMTAGAEPIRKDVWEIFYNLVELVDAQGQPFPGGINLSGSLDEGTWPTVVLKTMIGVGELPEALRMESTVDGDCVELK